jgi:hypothetical protein
MSFDAYVLMAVVLCTAVTAAAAYRYRVIYLTSAYVNRASRSVENGYSVISVSVGGRFMSWCVPSPRNASTRQRCHRWMYIQNVGAYRKDGTLDVVLRLTNQVRITWEGHPNAWHHMRPAFEAVMREENIIDVHLPESSELYRGVIDPLSDPIVNDHTGGRNVN